MTTFLIERLPQPPSMTERFHSEFDSTTSYYPLSHYSSGCSTRRGSAPKRSKKASSYYSYASDSDDESYDMRREVPISSKSTRTNSFYVSSASSVSQTSGDLAAIERELTLTRLHKQLYGSDYDSDESAEDTDDEEYAQWADDFFLEVETLRQQVHATRLCDHGVDSESEKRAIRTLYNRNHPNSPVMSRECSAYSDSDSDTNSETTSTFQDTECRVHLHRLRKDFYGSDYSDGDESAEGTDDEEYAEWVDDFLLEVDILRQQASAYGLVAPGDDQESERRCIRSLYNLNHPNSPAMSRVCSIDSAYSSI